jgi:hypothetical protein
MDTALHLLFPLIINLWLLGIQKPPITLKKIIDSSIVGGCISTVLLVVIGISGLDFVLFSRALFIIQFLFFSKGIITYFLNGIHKIFVVNPVWIVISVLIIKIAVLLLVRPIIDPDVVVSYIPFAQSTFLKSTIPHEDILTGEPISIPPPGGWINFSQAMAITNDVNTTIYKFLPLYYYIVLIAMVYSLTKHYYGGDIASLSVAVITVLPFNDEFIMTYALYPEIMFTMLFTYMFWKFKDKLDQANLIFICLSIALAILTKAQGVFFIPIYLSVVFLRQKNSLGKLFLLSIAALSIYLSLNPTKLNAVGFPPPNLGAALLIFVLITILGIWVNSSIKKLKKSETVISFNPAVIALTFSLLGFIWIGRSYAIFNTPFSDARESSIIVHQASTFLNKGKLYVANSSQYFALLFLGAFGTFFLIPKLLGFFFLIWHRKMIYITLGTALWFYYWVLFMGGVAATRYLLPCIPLISIAVALGINKMSNTIKAPSSLIVLVIGIISLSQSIFLSWNLGIGFFGYHTLKSFVSTIPNTNLTLTPKEYAISIASAINSHEENFLNYASTLFVIALLITVVSYLIVRLLNHIYSKHPYVVTSALMAMLLVPYITAVLTISEGKISNFSQQEKNKVYNYWGLQNIIIPFIKSNPTLLSKIIIFGPHIPLSYETGLQSRNIAVGFGLKDLGEILPERDLNTTFNFLKENGYNAFLVDGRLEMANKYRQMKNIYPSLGIFENDKYFYKAIGPTTANQWYLYIIKEASQI